VKEQIDIKLLPCPFCGSKAIFYENPWNIGVTCKGRDCKADVSFKNDNSTKEQVANKWNKRKQK